MGGITSTIKAGEGDAVIFGRESKLSPADNILSIGKQNEAANNQSKLLKQKLSNDNQTGFHKQLQDINSKVWSRDLPEVNDKINNLVKFTIDAQRKGVDPFSDPATMAEISGQLGHIDATAGASLGDKAKYEAETKALMEDQKSKHPNFDLAPSLAEHDARWSGTVAERALKPEFMPKYRELPAQQILTDAFMPKIKQLAASYEKQFNDKETTADATAKLQDGLKGMEMSAIDVLSPYIAQNRISVDDAVKQIRSAFAPYDNVGALYNNNKDQDQTQAQINEAGRNARAAAGLEFRKVQESNKQAASTVQPTETDALFGGALQGKLNTGTFAGLDLVDANSGEHRLTGNSVVEARDGKPYAIKTEWFTKDPKDDKKIIPAGYIRTHLIDTNGQPTYSSTQLYKAADAEAVKSKTVAINTDPGTAPVPVGAKKSTSQSTTNSNTIKSSVPVITTKAEFDALPSGSKFIKDGVTHTKK